MAPMDQYRHVVTLDDGTVSERKILQLLLDRLELEIVCEATPDYTGYELRSKRVSVADELRKWAQNANPRDGFVMTVLEAAELLNPRKASRR